MKLNFLYNKIIKIYITIIYKYEEFVCYIQQEKNWTTQEITQKKSSNEKKKVNILKYNRKLKQTFKSTKKKKKIKLRVP